MNINYLNLDSDGELVEVNQAHLVAFGNLGHPGMMRAFGGKVVTKLLESDVQISAIMGEKAHKSGTILRTIQINRMLGYLHFGVQPNPTSGDPILTTYPGANTDINGVSYYINSGQLYQAGAGAPYLPAGTPGSIVQIELNMDAKSVRFGLNGIWGTIRPLRVNAPHFIVVNMYTYGDSVKILRDL